MNGITSGGIICSITSSIINRITSDISGIIPISGIINGIISDLIRG
jgi:hypothetical protein